MSFKIARLSYPKAIRVWAKEKDIPEAAKALLNYCLTHELVVTVITFNLVNDEWEIIVWGDS